MEIFKYGKQIGERRKQDQSGEGTRARRGISEREESGSDQRRRDEISVEIENRVNEMGENHLAIL